MTIKIGGHAPSRENGKIKRGVKKVEATHVPYHAGSGASKTLHSPPRAGGGINDQNYAGQKVRTR